jgi:cytochrome c553
MLHLVFVGLGALGCATEASVTHTGPEIFSNNCAQCHGNDGEGTPSIGAPAIAGLPEWYVLQQVNNFRDGVRGQHFDDIAGMRMRPMARTLKDATEVAKVSATVAAMPRRPSTAAAHGDAAKGATSFLVCATCHGADGSGIEAQGGPPLVGQDPAYLAQQLRNFKAGVRGTDPRDVRGAQMRPMSMTLPDDAAIADVVAHISSLGAGAAAGQH